MESRNNDSFRSHDRDHLKHEAMKISSTFAEVPLFYLCLILWKYVVSPYFIIAAGTGETQFLTETSGNQVKTEFAEETPGETVSKISSR